jgi:hypothetical protein
MVIEGMDETATVQTFIALSLRLFGDCLFHVLCKVFRNINCEQAVSLASIQRVAGVPLT